MNRLPAFGLLALSALLLGACTRPDLVPAPVRAVRTEVVALTSAQPSHEFAAEIRARTESRLGFRVSGKLLRRSVEVGQTVRAGQLLAELDADDLKLGQEAAAAALRGAQVQVDQSEAELRRFRELREKGFISAAELERRESTVRAAQAQLEQARALAEVQRNQATHGRLLAPAAGVITAVEVEPGAVLAAGTPVLRLAQDGPRDAVFAVPEDAAAATRALIGRSSALRVRLWGSAAATPATVREVAAAADPTTRTFLVKADTGRSDLQLGRTAVVQVDQPVVAGVVRLPLAAVSNQQGRTVVWLVDPAAMTVRTQPVVVAGADGNAALIAHGLEAGQRVVTAGVHVLAPGQKVRLYVDPAQPAGLPPTATVPTAPVPAATSVPR